MKKVRRDELVDYQTWADDVRPDVQPAILAAKKLRRVHVGPNLTFLFENAATVRYQVQEMMRVERIVKESAIQHELDTYNELLGGDGELGCVLLVEFTDETERDAHLRAWVGMPAHWYAKRPDGTKVRATYDPRQVGTDRLSSVQYLKFHVGAVAPVAVGCDYEGYAHETGLTEEQQAALADDLAS